MTKKEDLLHVSINVTEGNWTADIQNSSTWMDIGHVLYEYHNGRTAVGEAQTLALIILYVISFLVATCANTLALAVFWKYKHMRRVSNSLLITLAVADLLVALVCMPMVIGYYSYRLWVFGDIMCKMTNYLQGVAVAASVFTMTVMSLDRYFAICHPIAFRRRMYRRHVLWGIFAVWVLAMVLFVPVLLVRRTRGFVLATVGSNDLYFMYCVETWQSATAREAFGSSIFTVVFVLPGVTMVIAYCRIGIRLCDRKEGLSQHDSHLLASQASSFRIRTVMDRRRLVAKRFVILTTVFAICWIPYNVAALLVDFQVDTASDGPLMTLLPFGLLLGHVNSAVNPLLYCWVNRRFRWCLADILSCRHRSNAVWDKQESIRLRDKDTCALPTARSSSALAASVPSGWTC